MANMEEVFDYIVKLTDKEKKQALEFLQSFDFSEVSE